MENRKTWTITAKLIFHGATMEVEAETEEEAREIADRSPDFYTDTAELTDWTITRVEKQ